MAGGTVSRTQHFALHRLGLLPAGAQATRPASRDSHVPGPEPVPPKLHEPEALFVLPGNEVAGPWLGAMVPKRWARRAVTRNAIKRQIYAAGADFESQLPVAAHVVRLRSTFDRKQFPSATSDALKQAVRKELEQLFAHAVRQKKQAQPQGAQRESRS